MYELGNKEDLFGMEQLRRLKIYERPTSFPHLGPDESVVCEFDNGLKKRMIVCQTLEEMQQLYDAYYKGLSLRISWWAGEDGGFVRVEQ